MAGRKLAANVWLDGKFHAAGSTPDKDVADRITNPNAWESEPKAEKSAEKSSSKSK